MTKIVSRLRSAYLNGRIIKEEDFQVIDNMIKQVSEIEKKENYLKKQGSIDKFIKLDFEDFELLAKEHSSMLSFMIDLEDIFSCILNNDFEVFASVEEANKQLIKTLEKINELRQEYHSYFYEEL